MSTNTSIHIRAPGDSRRTRCLGPVRPGGFTLIEVLIAVGLLAIVLGLLFVPIYNSLTYFRTATARADAQTVARSALDSMARELAEAMYVQLDMYDDSSVAFVPPLRVNPNDPNSEIVTPPRPDWSRAVRYWQALGDPTRNYNPGAYLEPSNMFFLARTVVPDPFTTNDPWNAWNYDRVAGLPATNGVGAAPWTRVVHTDIDYRFWLDPNRKSDRRNRTTQPGYPYLAAIYQYGYPLPPEGVRAYRNAVVSLTPNAPEYDVPQLSFTPTVVAGERLQPIDGPNSPDSTVYRARYPLWRQGQKYTGWSSLSPDVVALLRNLKWDTWARDPFLVISRYDPGTQMYVMQGLGAFYPITRTIKVLDLMRPNFPVYDTGFDYGQRLLQLDPADTKNPRFGFTVDYIDGSLRFDFPAHVVLKDPNALPGTTDPQFETVATSWLDLPLHTVWKERAGGQLLDRFIVPDSVTIRVGRTDPVSSKTVPGRALKRVYCAPRDGTDEFQLGTDPAHSTDVTAPRYGCIRLPVSLAALDSTGKHVLTSTQTLYIDFSWRNNGIVPAPTTLDPSPVERPDVVTTYYRTAAIIDVGVTVSRADPSAPVGKRIAQSSYMTQRVKLHNLLREIRYAENR